MINEKAAVERFNRQRERVNMYGVPSVCAFVPVVDKDYVTSCNTDAIDALEHLAHDCAILLQYALDLLKLAGEQ